MYLILLQNVRMYVCTNVYANVNNCKVELFATVHNLAFYQPQHILYVPIRTYVYVLIMEYGSTPYVGLTRKKHGRHTLAQILFSSEN